MEKKYVDMLHTLQELSGYKVHDINRIKDFFNDADFDAIQHMRNHHTEISNAEWGELYRKNENSGDVLLSMMKHPECPSLIREQIVTKAIDSVSKPFSTFDLSSHSEILTESLCFNMQKNLFFKVFELNPSHFLYKFNATEKNISTSAHNAMAQYVIDNPKIFKNDLYYYSQTKTLEKIFNGIEDKNFLYSLIEKAITLNNFEQLQTALINNKLLDVSDSKDRSLIYELFSNGVYNELIVNFTPEIQQYFLDNFIDIDNYSDDEIADKQDKIRALLNSGNISPAIEYDLAMKTLNRPNARNMPSLLSLRGYILCHTKHEGLMEIIKTLPLRDRRDVLLYNKNIPSEVYTDIVHEFCDKMRRKIKNNNIEKIPAIWLDDIEEYCKKVPLKDEDYEFLIENLNNKRDLMSQIAKSIYTPEKHLNKIIEQSVNNLNSKTPQEFNDIVNYIIANLNLSFKKNTINVEQYQALSRICETCNCVLIYTDKQFDGYLSSRGFSYLNFFQDVVDNSSKEQLIEFDKTIDKIFDETPNKTSLAMHHLTHLMHYILEGDSQRKTSSAPEYYSDFVLNQRIHILTKDIYSNINIKEPDYQFVTFYEQLPDMFEKFTLLYNEKMKREHSQDISDELVK